MILEEKEKERIKLAGLTSSGLSKQRKRAAGLCSGCGKPARDGRTTCAKCARKKYESERRKKEEKRGVPMKVGSGALPKYEIVAWRGREVIFRGTAREVAEHFGMRVNAVYEYCRRGIRRKKDMVFFERSLIDNGEV